MRFPPVGVVVLHVNGSQNVKVRTPRTPHMGMALLDSWRMVARLFCARWLLFGPSCQLFLFADTVICLPLKFNSALRAFQLGL